MLSFERIEIRDNVSKKMEDIGEINIFQTLPWLKFVAHMCNADPVIISIKRDGIVRGYFSGLIISKFGLRILGSPFRGWTTYFMGFNLMPGIPRKDILQSFPKFVFQKMHCHYLEITDPYLEYRQVVGLPYKVEHLPWFAVDLTPSEEVMFKNMKSSGRRGVRKAVKNGVTIEETSDIKFADEYYAQYKEVMTKRSLKPTFSLENVKSLIENVYPTKSLLMLRAKNPDGLCIATGLFVFLNKTAIYWGGASWQQHQNLRPNDLLMWHAMKTLKKHGAQILHLGGEAEQFKLKLGSKDAQVYRLRLAKNKLLHHSLDVALSIKNSYYRNLLLRNI